MAVTRAVSHAREPVCQCQVAHGGADKEPNRIQCLYSKKKLQSNPKMRKSTLQGCIWASWQHIRVQCSGRAACGSQSLVLCQSDSVAGPGQRPQRRRPWTQAEAGLRRLGYPCKPACRVRRRPGAAAAYCHDTSSAPVYK